MNKNKYYLYVVSERNKTYDVLLIKRIGVNTKQYQYRKGNNHSIDISNPTFSKNLKNYYFVEIEKGQLSFNVINKDDTNVRNLLYKHEVVKQLTLSLVDKLKIKFDIFWLVFMALGLMAGYMITSLIKGG